MLLGQIHLSRRESLATNTLISPPLLPRITICRLERHLHRYRALCRAALYLCPYRNKRSKFRCWLRANKLQLRWHTRCPYGQKRSRFRRSLCRNSKDFWSWISYRPLHLRRCKYSPSMLLTRPITTRSRLCSAIFLGRYSRAGEVRNRSSRMCSTCQIFIHPCHPRWRRDQQPASRSDSHSSIKRLQGQQSRSKRQETWGAIIWKCKGCLSRCLMGARWAQIGSERWTQHSFSMTAKRFRKSYSRIQWLCAHKASFRTLLVITTESQLRPLDMRIDLSWMTLRQQSRLSSKTCFSSRVSLISTSPTSWTALFTRTTVSYLKTWTAEISYHQRPCSRPIQHYSKTSRRKSPSSQPLKRRSGRNLHLQIVSSKHRPTRRISSRRVNVDLSSLTRRRRVCRARDKFKAHSRPLPWTT